MRPTEAFIRPRFAGAVDDAPLVPGDSSTAPPMMTYFLAEEADLATVDAASRIPDVPKGGLSLRKDGTAAAATADDSGDSDDAAGPRSLLAPLEPLPTAESSCMPGVLSRGRAAPVLAHAHAHARQPSSGHAGGAGPGFSPPLSQSGAGTPSLFGLSGPASLSATSSLSGSFLDDGSAAHAGASDSLPDLRGLPDLGASLSTPPRHVNMMDSGSAPQLIMPSIRMPSRRPFTETGKSMGRLKVMVAGAPGVGKTSLIKAIVQSCQHIVHVDHMAPPAGSITEVYASTKPYADWWSELDDGRPARRRKSLGDSVLDRNLCFVDTPGYVGQAVDGVDGADAAPAVQYARSLLQRLCSNTLSDADLVRLVSGDGGPTVDVVFYLVAGDLEPADVEYLQRLAPLTNIIPLLARADTLSAPGAVAAAKDRISRQLHEAGIRPFAFTAAGAATAESAGEPEHICYAISSTPGSDLDTMDASLLMSADYVQPLVPTELSLLVERVFCQDGMSRLRHGAARKVAQWRASRGHGQRTHEAEPALPRPPLLTTQTASLTPAVALAPSLSPAVRTRFADYTAREEYLAQIRLASWASELQRNLDRERARYESLARSERAVWLTERLSECVQDGTLVAVSRPRAGPRPARPARSPRSPQPTGQAERRGRPQPRSRPGKRHGCAPGMSASLACEDPLGLLQVTANLRARGLLMLEVLGGVGVLGGLALWLAKHNVYLQAYAWAVDEWARAWHAR